MKEDEVQYRQEDNDDMAQGFWPLSNWREHVPTLYRNFACKLEAKNIYVGPQRDKPRDCFNPLDDIGKGMFVLIRPDTEDLKTYPVYLGKVVSDIIEGEINTAGLQEHICKVEWWRPCIRNSKKKQYTIAEQYRNCWGKQWEQDPGYSETMINITTVVWSFKQRQNTKSSKLKIPPSHAKKALDNLQRCLEDEARQS